MAIMGAISYDIYGKVINPNASEKQLLKEAKQLGLKIFWCGSIVKTGETIKGYNTDESGAFSYKVNDDIEHLNFKVMEDDNNVYCTGIIIKLPENFVSAKDDK